MKREKIIKKEGEDKEEVKTNCNNKIKDKISIIMRLRITEYDLSKKMNIDIMKIKDSII